MSIRKRYAAKLATPGYASKQKQPYNFRVCVYPWLTMEVHIIARKKKEALTTVRQNALDISVGNTVYVGRIRSPKINNRRNKC